MLYQRNYVITIALNNALLFSNFEFEREMSTRRNLKAKRSEVDENEDDIGSKFEIS